MPLKIVYGYLDKQHYATSNDKNPPKYRDRRPYQMVEADHRATKPHPIIIIIQGPLAEEERGAQSHTNIENPHFLFHTSSLPTPKGSPVKQSHIMFTIEISSDLITHTPLTPAYPHFNPSRPIRPSPPSSSYTPYQIVDFSLIAKIRQVILDYN